MEKYVIANCTDTGRVRAVNEDSMVTFDSPNGQVVVVCDGMGGQNAGDVASQLAVAVIQDILTDNTFASPDEAISSSIMAANQAVLRKASQDPSLTGMGATCVMLIVKDGVVYYGSVGDSRIYYIANGMIQQLTKDQSYVQTLVDAGQLTPEAAEYHQDKNQITNALGIEGMTPPVLGAAITPVHGSVFLLCSDGLTGMVPNSDILGILSKADIPLGERAKMLVNRANQNGGADNITVQLVEFGNSLPTEGLTSSNGYGSYGRGLNAKPKAKTSSKVIAILSVVLLLLVVGGGAYWYFSKDKSKTESKVVTQPSRSTSNNSSSQFSERSTSKTTSSSGGYVETTQHSSQSQHQVSSNKSQTRKNIKKKAEKSGKQLAKEVLDEKKSKTDDNVTKKQNIVIKKFVGNKNDEALEEKTSHNTKQTIQPNKKTDKSQEKKSTPPVPN